MEVSDEAAFSPGKLCHQPFCANELRQSNQIVGGGSEGEGPPDATATAELRLLLPGHRLEPAERLFDALADALTDGIAAVPRRASIAELRPLVFCATCGVTVIERSSLPCRCSHVVDLMSLDPSFEFSGLRRTIRRRARHRGRTLSARRTALMFWLFYQADAATGELGATKRFLRSRCLARQHVVRLVQ